jgi:tetratricopeptide (TPR) repeat protein/predicted aspartyl protease
MCLSTLRGRASACRRRTIFAALLALGAAHAAGADSCKLAQVAQLPVTMQGMRPLVHAAINGTDALFIADSGAFFSMLTPAAARQFNLELQHTAVGFYVTGVGGSAETWITTVKTFKIFDVELHKIPFLVAGNDDLGYGAVGLLGQNVFRVGDVDYDLANGMISIMRPLGDCSHTSLAYWVKGQPYSVIDIEAATSEKPHTTGEAYLNGKKIRVVFDTGAAASVLTLDAARSAGVTPNSPGVKPGGSSHGIGHHVAQSWIAPFPSFKIGDEEVRNTHLRIGESGLPWVDMLIGADFFLSHHVYVAGSQHKLYFTYNGGPVFNLTTVPAATAGTPAPPDAAAPPTGAVPPTGAGASQAATGAAPPADAQSLDAAGYARRGNASASRHEYAPALADLTSAIELSPSQPEYFYERGRIYWAAQQPDKALADFGQAISLKPDYADALLARATLRAQRHDPPESVTSDLDAAERASPNEAPMRLEIARLYSRLRNYPQAVAQFDRWIAAHNADEVQMPVARNGRCWALAMTGQDLERALDDCNSALRAFPKEASFLDSRGLVYFRLGRYDKAIADYDAALTLKPKLVWSLYVRGLAKGRLGQSAAGQADVAAATQLAPNIAEEAAKQGIAP